MATERNADFFWDIVVFKVECALFRVPRDGLVKASEAFAGMFSLPVGGEPGNAEGRSDEHPIILEGYKAADFQALLKIIYPTPDDVIAGAFKLSKAEWIGVLDLSTRWSMKMIRQHAILRLSSLELSAIEKINLARTHSVLKWFEEAINTLVTAPTTPALEEIHALGLETACRILWIRNQVIPPPSTTHPSQLTLGSLKCNKCYSSMFTGKIQCSDCPKNISPDEPNVIFVDKDTSTRIQYRTGKAAGTDFLGPYFTIDLSKLSCGGRNTHYPVKCMSYTCPSCKGVVAQDQFLLGPSVECLPHTRPSSLPLVEKVFRNEIEDLKMMDKD